MMALIEAKMKTMLEDEIKKQPANERMPPNVRGRLYTPAPGSGVFLVKIVPDEAAQGGKVVTVLIRWSDLYVMAFYLQAVWYLYKDFDAKMLPPPSQLPHNQEHGVGIIKLPIDSSYASIGGYNINVGKASFTHCFHTLGKIGELYSTEQGLKVLQSGPLSLPTVTISEAIRFKLWRDWVIGHMDGEIDIAVTTEHYSLFNHWSDISTAVAKNSSWRGLGADELVKILNVLMRNSHIKVLTAKSEGSSSGSREK